MTISISEKILKIISELELDLRNKTVLTEAATGAYVVTPIIAAAAGAKVIAFTKNTKYGSVEEVKNQTNNIIKSFKKKLDITIVEELSPEMLNTVDIITNSGHLRPIGKDVLMHLKPGVIVSYMYEAWEYRKEDLDIEFCKKNNISVVATNERHPNIDVFNYLGELAVKLIHNSGKCVYRNKFIIISNNDFGYHIAKTLVRLSDKVGVIDLPKNQLNYPNEIEWLGNFPDITIPENFADAEAVIFTAYPFEDTWIQKDGEIKADHFSKLSSPFILRYAGHMDTSYLNENNIDFYPEFVKCGHMGILLSELGFDPVIRLQAGGLKAGQLCIKDIVEYNNVPVYEKLN